ncbi:hypothetical protein [Citrifermentans bremense]|uniref:hypothetical protein n=1 Tax=Citrifermentans bremense TaxID=60035 RepID=UPI0012EB7E5C|nr:hypothetical protein [Citrifermentans bremense]
MATIALVKAVILLVGGVMAIYCFSLARMVRKADPNEYRNAKNLSGSLSQVLRGKVTLYHDGVRDSRVKAGLAIDKRRNKWVPHGALSRESIESVFK